MPDSRLQVVVTVVNLVFGYVAYLSYGDCEANGCEKAHDGSYAASCCILDAGLILMRMSHSALRSVMPPHTRPSCRHTHALHAATHTPFVVPRFVACVSHPD